MIKKTMLGAVACTAGFCLSPHQATASPAEISLESQCKFLAKENLANLIDAPTQITTTELVVAAQNIPTHCKVEGYVAPQVGFILELPGANWNGKFLQLGCGGACGYLAERECRAPLQKGYACLVFDAGHRGGGGLWAVDNLQAQIDFGYRGAHVASIAGKAIAERYYSRAPEYAYFSGCSTGGRQALVLAQRFPEDFDGIISGAPWINDSDSSMYYVWANRVLSGEDGKPIVGSVEQQWVHDAVLAKCEMDDGVKDGIIGNPAACKFDPLELVCRDGKNDACLSPQQAAAVKKMYEGPVDSKGKKLYVGGVAPGSELVWKYFGGSERWAELHFRHLVMPAMGPAWELKDYDFDRDPVRFASGVQESLLNAGNPDLRKFKAAGGKLLIYQGWNDTDDLPAMTIDYYETVERTMGGRAATQDFARLFMVPGMNHCGWGDGAFMVDYLSALERWVEKNQPPEKLIGAHVKDLLWEDATGLAPPSADQAVAFTRPMYPYPLWSKYKGKGNPNDAENFKPVFER